MSPFTFEELQLGVKQIKFNGSSWGKKFLLSSKDTAIFVEMLNNAFKLGKGEKIETGGLSINVNEKIKSSECIR